MPTQSGHAKLPKMRFAGL